MARRWLVRYGDIAHLGLVAIIEAHQGHHVGCLIQYH